MHLRRFLAFTSLLLSSATIPAAERIAAELFPPTTIAYAEIKDPAKLLAAVFDHPLRGKIESLGPYQQAFNHSTEKNDARIESHVSKSYRLSKCYWSDGRPAAI